ncbi:FAD-dependent monooxygenase, partial [Streptomyces rimosus]
VTARLRAADRALPLLRDGERVGRWRAVLPGAARGHTAMLTDGHLGRGPLGAPPAYARSPLAPATDPAGTLPVGTPVGAPVADVPVTAPDGSQVPLRSRLGHGLLVVLVAPGTGVWERRHWKSAGLMPRLTKAVEALPMRAEVLVAEAYPGAVAHTVLVVRPDGHLVAAMGGVRPAELYACADAVRGGGTGGGSDEAGTGAGAAGSDGAGGRTGEPSRTAGERAHSGARSEPYPETRAGSYPDTRSGPFPDTRSESHSAPHSKPHPEAHSEPLGEPAADRRPESHPSGGPLPVDGAFPQAGGETPGGAPGSVSRDVPEGVSEAQVRSAGG